MPYELIEETIDVSEASVSAAGFGIPLILAAAGEGTTEELVSSYAPSDTITADYASDTDAYAAFQAIKTQTRLPSRVKIGLRAADVQQVQTVTFPADFQSGATITVNLDAIAVSVVYATSHTATFNALLAAIDAQTTKVSAADTTGDPVTRILTITTAKDRAVAVTGALTVTGAVTVVGAAAAVVAQTVAAQTISTRLDAITAEDPDWFGLIVAERDDVDAYRAAAWVAANSRIYSGLTTDQTLAAALQALTNNNTLMLVYQDDSQYIDAGWMGFNLATDLDVKTGNWHVSKLTGFTAENLTTTEIDSILEDGGSCFVSVHGSPRPI